MGPVEALVAVRDARAPLAAMTGLVDAPRGAGSRSEWLHLVTACQELLNTVTAVQDAAIARSAAIEDEFADDGTTVERDHGVGHAALDAPDLVAGALEVSHVHAEHRVTRAVRCVAGGPGASSGLRPLHAAMMAGRIDDYRVSVIAEELAEAPPDVAGAVVRALEPYLGTETAAHLRKRCRRILATVSPDLLRQRAVRARRECGLRRWAASPGVDQWEGTFPSEQAAAGWAAVDALAQRYVADGVCDGVEAARGRALIDLVTGRSTIDVRLLVTVPAAVDDGVSGVVAVAEAAKGGAQPVASLDPPPTSSDDELPRPARSGDDLVEVFGALPGGDPVLVPRGWLSRFPSSPVRPPVDRLRDGRAPCHPTSGALLDQSRWRGTAHRPPAWLVALVRSRDGRCRFPGCSVAARFCDLDHVRPWPAGPTTAGNLMCLCRRHHRIKQLPGWLVVLADDAVATWRDPTGRVRTSAPRDLLHSAVLPAGPHEGEPRTDASADAVGRGGARRDWFGTREGAPHSALEMAAEHAILRGCEQGGGTWARWAPAGTPEAGANWDGDGRRDGSGARASPPF